MFDRIAQMLPTIVVSAVLLAVVAGAVMVLARDRKKGKSSCGGSCGGNCGGCPMGGSCHGKR